MTVLYVTIGTDGTRCRCDDQEYMVPVGAGSLTTGGITSDPPRPEELTNAIGLVIDHLDDLARDMPDVVGASVVLTGPEAEAIAAVESGHTPVLPMRVSRDVVEEVFRTLATETTTDRAKNPGLVPEVVGTIVAGCCIAVAIMRRLHLDELTIGVAASAPTAPSDAP